MLYVVKAINIMNETDFYITNGKISLFNLIWTLEKTTFWASFSVFENGEYKVEPNSLGFAVMSKWK